MTSISYVINVLDRAGFPCNESVIDSLHTIKVTLDRFQHLIRHTDRYRGALAFDIHVSQGGRERPTLNIVREQLELLLDLHFSVAFIAKLYGVNRRTMHRTMSESGFSISSRYSDISDNNLGEIVHDLLKYFPRTGYQGMMGSPRDRNIQTQEHRVRECMGQVDYVSVIQQTIKLTVIKVPLAH